GKWEAGRGPKGRSSCGGLAPPLAPPTARWRRDPPSERTPASKAQAAWARGVRTSRSRREEASARRRMRSGDSCERAFLQDGKDYGEDGAFSRAAHDGDPAMVLVANPVHHRESPPLRAAVLPGGAERLAAARTDPRADPPAGARNPARPEAAAPR